MKLLIIDTETADSENTACEISGTLYQVTDNPRTTGAIASVSTLIPVVENTAEAINGICSELTQDNCIYLDSLGLLTKMSQEADYNVAFNAEFDSGVVKALLPDAFPQPWLCAMKDMDWGYHTANSHGGYKLTDLALWMGIGISTVHRAGDDVRLLVECFNRHDNPHQLVQDAIALTKSPIIELKALVTYQTRHLASDAKFAWDGERKIWHKKIRECHLPNFQNLDFKIEVLIPTESSS